MKIMSGADARPTLLALLYGQTKLYKTTTALMAPPEWRPIAYLDADRGARIRLRILSMTPKEREAIGVVEKLPPTAGPWVREGIDFFYPEETNWYADCHDFCSNILYSGKYKLGIIDTGARVADGILREVKNSQYEGTGKDTKRVAVTSGGITTTHPTPSDYGFAQDRFMELLKAADESPCHLLLVTHEKVGEVGSDDSGVPKRVVAGPRLVGNALLEVVPSVMDLAIRLAVVTVREEGKMRNKIVMRTQNHNYYLAGDRSGLFEDGQDHDPALFWTKLGQLVALGAPPAAVAKDVPKPALNQGAQSKQDQAAKIKALAGGS